IRIDIEPAQLSQRVERLAPELPVEPIVVVAALEPSRMQQRIDLHGSQTAERSGKSSETGQGVPLHRLSEPRQRRQMRRERPIEARGARTDRRPIARIAAEDLIPPLAT